MRHEIGIVESSLPMMLSESRDCPWLSKIAPRQGRSGGLMLLGCDVSWDADFRAHHARNSKLFTHVLKRESGQESCSQLSHSTHNRACGQLWKFINLSVFAQTDSWSTCEKPALLWAAGVRQESCSQLSISLTTAPALESLSSYRFLCEAQRLVRSEALNGTVSDADCAESDARGPWRYTVARACRTALSCSLLPWVTLRTICCLAPDCFQGGAVWHGTFVQIEL